MRENLRVLRTATIARNRRYRCGLFTGNRRTAMGLLDQILGGRAQPGGGRGGMSPLMMLLLGLMAYRAYTNRGAAEASAPAGGAPAPGTQPAGPAEGSAPGGLGDLLRGGLGGVLGGAAAGGMLNNGLRDLIDRFQQAGHGDIADSWVGTGPNRPVTPRQIEDALGRDTVDSLAREAGINDVALLQGLSQDLPEAVDQLTPGGYIPDEQA